MKVRFCWRYEPPFFPFKDSPGGWRLVVGGGWRVVAVGGPCGWSLRAVLLRKKEKNWGSKDSPGWGMWIEEGDAAPPWACTSRPQKCPDEVGGNIPSNVPEMYPVSGKMGEMGGNEGGMGGNGGKWGGMGANGGRWGKWGEIGGGWGEMRGKWREMGGTRGKWGGMGANGGRWGEMGGNGGGGGGK